MWNFSWLDIWWQSFRRPLCLLSCLCGLLLQQKISTRHHCDSHTWQPLTVSIQFLNQPLNSWGAASTSGSEATWVWFTIEYCESTLLFLLRFKSLQDSHILACWPRLTTTYVWIATASRCKVVLFGDLAAGKRPKIVSVTLETSNSGRIIKKPDITWTKFTQPYMCLYIHVLAVILVLHSIAIETFGSLSVHVQRHIRWGVSWSSKISMVAEPDDPAIAGEGIL